MAPAYAARASKIARFPAHTAQSHPPRSSGLGELSSLQRRFGNSSSRLENWRTDPKLPQTFGRLF